VTLQNMLGQEVEATASLSLNKKEIRLTIAPAAVEKNSMLMLSVLSPNDTHREKVLINQH